MDNGIQIIPVGKIDKRILRHVKDSVSDTFRCPITVGGHIPVPEEALDHQRKRYSAVKILQNLEYNPRKRLLAIVDLDLYVDRVNYLFGLAETPGQKGIVGIHRLRGSADFSMFPSNQFLDSIAKEAIHEIGHTFGLHHCTQCHCVMAFSLTLSDTLFKSMKFCRNCAMELAAQMHVPHHWGNHNDFNAPETYPLFMDGIPSTGDPVSRQQLR